MFSEQLDIQSLISQRPNFPSSKQLNYLLAVNTTPREHKQVMIMTINTACHNFRISGALNFPSLASTSMPSLCCVLWRFRPPLQRSLFIRSHYHSPAHLAGITGHQPCANSGVPDLTMSTNSLLQSLPWELLSFPFLHLLLKSLCPNTAQFLGSIYSKIALKNYLYSASTSTLSVFSCTNSNQAFSPPHFSMDKALIKAPCCQIQCLFPVITY